MTKVKCNNCGWSGTEDLLQDELCPKCGMNSEGKIMDIEDTMTDKEKMERLDVIYDRAIANYLEKIGFDYSDWLNAEELKEYGELYKQVNGECPLCGDLPEDCKCNK